MSARAFVDTNVLVYLFDDDEPVKQGQARALRSDRDGPDLVVSTQVLGEFYVTVTRKLARPVEPEAAAAAVAEISALPVVSVDADLVRSAIDTAQRHQLSYWDALIVEAAVNAGCELLLSEDLADGATIRGVTVENPFSP